MNLKLIINYKHKTDVKDNKYRCRTMCLRLILYIKDVDIFTIHVDFTDDFTGQ